MADTCTHLDQILDVAPSSTGCEDCLAAGRRDWVHLRVCQQCGHVGCCDNSPGRHATAHFHASGHPIIRSFEPGEFGPEEREGFGPRVTRGRVASGLLNRAGAARRGADPRAW